MIRNVRWIGYFASIAVTALATLICLPLHDRIDHANIIMVYLLGVAFVASRYRVGEAVFASLLSVAAFDVLFVEPRGRFAVSDSEFLVTFGVMLAVALLISSLTLRVRGHERIVADARLRAETERMRSTLLASVSHDLRTPLTSIAGAAETLQAGKGDTRELGSMIHSEAHRLDRQVRNLLDVVRLQSEEFKPRLEWQSVDEMLGGAVARAEGALTPRRVTLDIEGGLPLLRADAALMERVFANLFENTVRHTPETARLDVSALQKDGHVVISFTDDGPGIPPGQERAIFSRFSQRSAWSSGFGLGLAVCGAIAELHGGSIRAENGPEGGAAFRLELPVPPQPEAPHE